MSKAILVMDMPKDCCDCRFCRELDEGVKACCELMDNPSNSELCRRIDVHYCYEKPEWCPLRELPQKQEDKSLKVVPTAPSQYTEYVKGYNACIDEIIGGAE